jgi:hypothetical protein
MSAETGVRQPDVKRDLRRLAGRADEQEERRPEGHRRPQPRQLHEGAAAARRRRRCRREVAEVERPGGVVQQEHPDQEPEVADPVGDEGLLARVGVGVRGVPKTNQQVAAEPHPLPADEHDGEAVAQHQHQHRAAEQVQVGEEARVVGVVLHVARRIDVNQKPDEGDDQTEQTGERVHAERQIDLEAAGRHPGPDHVVQTALGRCARQRGEERVERHQAGPGDGARGDDQHGVALPLAAEQHQDRRPQEGQERDQAKVEGHGGGSLSASSRWLRRD